MLQGNQLYDAFKKAGMDLPPLETRKKKHKQFKCFKCGEPMIFVDNSNVMTCSKCNQFYIFDTDSVKYY